MFRAAEFREAETPEVTLDPCAAEALGLCEPDAPVAADGQPAEQHEPWLDWEGALGVQAAGRRRDEEGGEEEDENFAEFEDDEDEELDDDDEDEELYEDDLDEDDDDDLDELEEDDEE